MMNACLHARLLIGAVLASSIFLVTACGGGGSSTPTATAAVVVDPNLSVPVQTAIASLVTQGVSKSFVLSGWINHSTLAKPVPNTPITGSGNLTIGPSSTVVANSGPLTGISAFQSVQVVSGTSTSGGQSSGISGTSKVYYSTSNYTVLSTWDGTDFTYYSPYTYPTSVKAGDTGPFGDGTTGGFFPLRTAAVYSVASDSATSLLVTISRTTGTYGGGSTVSRTVYRISTSGAIQLVSLTVDNALIGSVYQSLTYTFS